MGDVGSASLGFIFAILLLHDAHSPNFLVWIMLLSLFWFDATITLFRRFKNREKISKAHKKHMYQRLHQAGWSHQKVLITSIFFNILIFVLIWLTQPQYYLYLLGSILLILWGILKYTDRQKGFE
jgi:Fuc2NAc and GlcNAc transferase